MVVLSLQVLNVSRMAALATSAMPTAPSPAEADVLLLQQSRVN